jgi:hypothetical protein
MLETMAAKVESGGGIKHVPSSEGVLGGIFLKEEDRGYAACAHTKPVLGLEKVKSPALHEGNAGEIVSRASSCLHYAPQVPA